MAAKIKTLFDKLGKKIYPKTKTSAVYDDSNVVLDTILNGKQNATDNSLETTSKTVIGAINEVNSALIDIDGNGTVKVAVNPSASEIMSFEKGAAWVETPPLKLYLEFSSDEGFILSVSSPGWNGIIEYSLDNGSTWSTWDGSELSGTASQPIYLRGTGNTIVSNGEPWTFTGKYVTGNIETLLDYQTVVNGQHPTMGSFCYRNMFSGCTSLVTAPELPATTLATGCYDGMFQGCTSLTTAPELPATTLANGCYRNMFTGCTSLTTPPELPATTLANFCYGSMFDNCTSLTTPPELPATTLTRYCYSNMFSGCSSLITLPELPATTLADSCYQFMFTSCTSLKLSTTQTGNYQYPYRIPTSGTGTDADSALMDMFTGTGGTFTDSPTINTTYYTDHQPISSNLETTTNSTELCIKINNSEKRLNLDENVANKLDKYTSGSSDWDSAPTQNSTKAVTSGGIYQAISDNIEFIVNDLILPSVNGIRTDLGSPSSAGTVTGDDAFSKINTLSSDLTVQDVSSSFKSSDTDLTLTYAIKVNGFVYLVCQISNVTTSNSQYIKEVMSSNRPAALTPVMVFSGSATNPVVSACIDKWGQIIIRSGSASVSNMSYYVMAIYRV